MEPAKVSYFQGNYQSQGSNTLSTGKSHFILFGLVFFNCFNQGRNYQSTNSSRGLYNNSFRVCFHRCDYDGSVENSYKWPLTTPAGWFHNHFRQLPSPAILGYFLQLHHCSTLHLCSSLSFSNFEIFPTTICNVQCSDEQFD